MYFYRRALAKVRGKSTHIRQKNMKPRKLKRVMQRGTSLSIIELSYFTFPRLFVRWSAIGISWWGGTREHGIGN